MYEKIETEFSKQNNNILSIRKQTATKQLQNPIAKNQLQSTMSNTIGPWYESTGPSADFVRKDIFRTIKKKPDERIIVDEERDEKIIAILLKNIPDTMTGFGSWRGYFTFGFNKKIMGSL